MVAVDVASRSNSKHYGNNSNDNTNLQKLTTALRAAKAQQHEFVQDVVEILAKIPDKAIGGRIYAISGCSCGGSGGSHCCRMNP